MNLLKAIFGNVKMSSGVGIPEIRRTRREQALYPTGEYHRIAHGGARIPVMKVDLRRLERSKYAPWGRGDLSGLPVIKQTIPATNY